METGVAGKPSRTFKVRFTEKIYRLHFGGIMNHAPRGAGIYELVVFAPGAEDGTVLYVGQVPEGGSIVIAGTPDDLFIRIAGSPAAWPAGMGLCLADSAEAQSALMDGRNIQMALTALFAHAAGIRLSVLFSPAAHAEPAILRLGR